MEKQRGRGHESLGNEVWEKQLGPSGFHVASQNGEAMQGTLVRMARPSDQKDRMEQRRG